MEITFTFLHKWHFIYKIKCSQVNQTRVSNAPKPQPHHVKPGSSATRQVIHVTMSDTSHCHVNNTAKVKQDDTKKAMSMVSTTTTGLPAKSPSSEHSASSDARSDPGSSVAYQLVEQVHVTFCIQYIILEVKILEFIFDK
jgi:hypothetical protein